MADAQVDWGRVSYQVSDDSFDFHGVFKNSRHAESLRNTFEPLVKAARRVIDGDCGADEAQVLTAALDRLPKVGG